MMKLLLVVNDYCLGGGGERVATNIADHYIEYGWDVTLLSFVKQRTAKLESKASKDSLNCCKNKILSKIQAVFRLNKYLNSYQPDYVLAIGSYPSTVLGLTKMKGVKKIGSEHSHYYNTHWIWNYLRGYAYPNLDAISVLTSHDLPILAELNKKTVRIPNASSFSIEQVSDQRCCKAVAIGRFDEYKCFGDLIDIFADFCQYNKDWTLDIIGSGPLESELRAQITRLDLCDRISILPYTNNIEDVYKCSSILLSTSIREGLPMTMIEAQSKGLPIISYDCLTGPADIILDGRNGYLVPIGDKHKFLECLLDLAIDNNKRDEMSKNSIFDSERFAPSTVYSMWDNLFSSL